MLVTLKRTAMQTTVIFHICIPLPELMESLASVKDLNERFSDDQKGFEYEKNEFEVN